MAEVLDSEESSDNEEVLYHSSDDEFDARSDEEVSSENEEPETSTRSCDEQGWSRSRGRARGTGRGRCRGRGTGRGGSPAPRRQRKNIADWQQHQGVSVTMPAFALEDVGPICPDAEPEHVVDLFITPDIVSMIKIESNRRAHIELGSSKPPVLLKLYKDITLADVYAYLAVIIIMGLVQLPNEEDYWSTDTILTQGIVQNILPRMRFKQIKHCLMVANPTPTENESDRLAKVRPFLDLVQQISQARYNPQQQTLS